MPSGCCGDDGIGVGFPAERLRIDVVFGEVSVDGGLEIDDSEEGASPEPSLDQSGEEAFDRIQPGGLVGVKWKVTRGWRASQAITFGCLWAA